ncbi:hypothetical protein BN14_02384 [Rhizoctonia solani AG-1 IB]|uniref:Uncharacterized protein n=1 Tax=Thanatephorus cucumeris (strain AG1-IB / isolate 7/3/14) TaxID=1108050 RepID=M5BN08_THACB|nr:hypothetical protein BN14_02384 [Rhizoctonia solani AG-1 IB]
MAAEVSILQSGIEAAMEASVFESPPGSPNSDVQDTFDGMASPEMSGATLRDLYAKAWERAFGMDAARTRSWRWRLELDSDPSFVDTTKCTYSQPTRFRRFRRSLFDYGNVTLCIRSTNPRST